MQKKLIILALLTCFHCGEGNLELTGPPSLVSLSRASGSIIAENSQIIFTFDQPIASVSLSGTLGQMARATINSTKVTIIPQTTYNAGNGQTLILTPTNEKNINGETTNATYDVYTFANAVYVSDGFGLDSNVGTQALPKKTIAAGISAAAALFSNGTVRIAQKAGGYDVGNGSLSLVDRISLEGGYSYNGATWSGPNATANETIITRSTGSGGGVDDPLATMLCGNGISSSTNISKLTIQGINEQYTTAVRANSGCQATFEQNKMISGLPNASAGRGYALYIGSGASPIIRSNNIDPNTHGATPPNFLLIVGIRVLGGNPIIERNTILRGENQLGTSTSAHGIFQKDSSSATIRNNVIYGGYGNLLSHGLLLDNSTSNIFNNTIILGRVSGPSNLAQAILLRNTSAPNISNNIIIKDASTTHNVNCIEEHNTGTNNPSALQNNGLFGCTVLYKDKDSGQDFNNLCSGNFGLAGCATVLATPTGTNNITSDPGLDANGADNIFRTLTDNVVNGAAASYQNAGLNLDSFFTDDFTGTTRPASPTAWTIGAYE